MLFRSGNAAVFDYATGGPCFGAADLVIGEPKAAVMGGFAGPDMMDSSVNAGSLKGGRSTVGGSYDFVNGWPVRGKFELVQLEVYCNAAISASSSMVVNRRPSGIKASISALAWSGLGIAAVLRADSAGCWWRTPQRIRRRRRAAGGRSYDQPSLFSGCKDSGN